MAGGHQGRGGPRKRRSRDAQGRIIWVIDDTPDGAGGEAHEAHGGAGAAPDGENGVAGGAGQAQDPNTIPVPGPKSRTRAKPGPKPVASSKRQRPAPSDTTEPARAEETRVSVSPDPNDEPKPLGVDRLTAILMFVHDSVATMTGIPDISLHQSQAKKLAEDLQDVSKFYGIKMSPKTQALIALGTTVAIIEGPRVRMIAAKAAAARRAGRGAAKAPAGPVAPARTSPPSAPTAAAPAPMMVEIPAASPPVVGGTATFDNKTDAGPGRLDLTGAALDPRAIVTGLEGTAPAAPKALGGPVQKGRLDLTGDAFARHFRRH